MTTPVEAIECMVQKALKYLPEYKTHTGDIRAVCAAKVYGLGPADGQPYDGDLVRMFGGFKNEDGSSRSTYDPDVCIVTSSRATISKRNVGYEANVITGDDEMDECGWRTSGPGKNWRGNGQP